MARKKNKGYYLQCRGASNLQASRHWPLGIPVLELDQRFESQPPDAPDKVCTGGHASHGFKRGTLVGAKSFTFRDTIVRLK
jgi:hypothetical protein